MRRPGLGRRRGPQDLAIARLLVTIVRCWGERPSDGTDRQEEREAVTGGTQLARIGSRSDGVAGDRKKALVTGALRDERITADQPRLQPGSRTGWPASPPPYAGPSRGLTGLSVAGAKPVESERTGTLVGALVARRRSRVAIRPGPAGGE